MEGGREGGRQAGREGGRQRGRQAERGQGGREGGTLREGEYKIVMSHHLPSFEISMIFRSSSSKKSISL